MPKNILDNITQVKKIDSRNMLGSLQYLNRQVEQIWQEAQSLKLSGSYKRVKNILVVGMGGSTLGTHMLKSVFNQELKVPVEIVNDYNIPAYVNNQTLVIASSYSGTTEEMLSAAKQAKAKKAKMLAISSGGSLASWARKNKVPALVFATDNNPSNQPRMGQGYMVIGQMILLSRAGLLQLSAKKVKDMIKTLAYYNSKFGMTVSYQKNPAKQAALAAAGKSVWYVGSEHLLGNIHAGANQMNENAKRFGGSFPIPELNHHLLEGMFHPKSNKSDLLFILCESKLYHPRNQKRYKITQKVLDKNGVHYFNYTCQEKNQLLQACEVLVFTGYISFYTAMQAGIDPSPIPLVDFFKKQMK